MEKKCTEDNYKIGSDGYGKNHEQKKKDKQENNTHQEKQEEKENNEKKEERTDKKKKKRKNHKHHRTTKTHHDQKQQSKENIKERNKNDTLNLETEKEIENQNEDETHNNEIEIETQNEDKTDNNKQICPDGDGKKVKKQNNRTERYIISKLCEDKLKKIDVQEIFHKNGKRYTCKLCIYFNLNKNRADVLDHYTTKHAHISGVFCPKCYKNFQSIGAAKKHNIRQNCLFNDSVLQRNKAIFAQ